MTFKTNWTTLFSSLTLKKVLVEFKQYNITYLSSKFIFFVQMMRVNCDTAQEYYIQQTVKDKLQGYSFTHPKCTGSVLVELTIELRQIKEEFISSGGKLHNG